MNFQKTLFLSLCLAFSAAIPAQETQFQWMRGAGSSEDDITISVAVDPARNVYSIGTFSGNCLFDAGPGNLSLSALGSSDLYIAKHNATGQLLWVKKIGNNNATPETPKDLAIDATGNIYVTGSFSGTLDFDPGPAVANVTCTGAGSAAFLLKLTTDGNFVWAKNIAQSDNNNMGYSLAVAPSGNIYVSGTFKGTTDFDPGPGNSLATSTGTIQDMFISKFTNTGDLTWSKQFPGTEACVGYSIGIDASENIFTGGFFYGSADLDPGTPSFTLTSDNSVPGSWADVFVSKLDQNGNFAWAKQITGAYNELSFAIALDPVGNVIISGEYEGVTDFDPGPGVFPLPYTDGDTYTFIAKLDPGGSLIWVKGLGNLNGICQTRAITCDLFGDIYIPGTFIHTIDFDPGPAVYSLTTPGDWATAYLLKLHSDGTFAFAKQMAGSLFAITYATAVDDQKNILISGHFYGTIDFDPESTIQNYTSRGNSDGFVLKLSQCLQSTSSTLQVTACNSYTLNGHTYTSSGTFIQHLTNASGCDSTITLQLTLGGSTSTTTTTACDSFFWEGTIYHFSGFYSVTYTGADGCDSIRRLDLTIHNSSSTVVNASICAGENFLGYNTTGVYTDVFTLANGCDSTRTLNLTVRPVSQTSLTATICEGETYLGYNSTGIYRDTLTAANGCDSIRILDLHVTPLERTDLSAAICQGEMYFAGGSNQINSGIYRDTLTSATGCDSIVTTFLTVYERPAPNLGEDRDLCDGTTLSLTPGAFAAYEWQDHSTLPSFGVATTGTFWVLVTDAHGCTSSDTLTIMNLLTPPANFLEKEDSICQFDKLELKPIGSFSEYTWFNGSHQPSVFIDQPGIYTLDVRGQNGCYGSASIHIYQQLCKTGVFIPTAFTPDGNGRNDFFRARVYGNLLHFELKVFNRWGQPVFQTTDPTHGWNGRVNGKEPETASFVWYCSYQLGGESLVLKRGVVTLVR